MLAVAPVKKIVPRPARKHVARRLAADQKPAIAGKFPGLEEQFFGGVQQRLVDVRSGVEKTDLDRPDVLFDLGEQFLNFGFLAGIDAERVSLEARGLQFIDQSLGFGRVAPADADGVAAFGKAPGHGRADGIACADQYCYAALFRHPCSPISSYLVLNQYRPLRSL